MDEHGEAPTPDPLEEALDGLEAALRALPFRLPTPGRAARVVARDRLAGDVLAQRARWRDRDAPLLVVLGGGTGAGKSTVLNSLVGKSIAATGVLRPTTTSPTLVATPGEMPWFTSERILPDLPRAERRGRTGAAATGSAAAADTPATADHHGADSHVLHLVPSRVVPDGLALVDAPDIDSVRTEHRDLADALLDAADVWAWHTTARTYADEDGMAYLRRAARRRTALAIVLTQVHEREAEPIREDLRAKLDAAGLDVAILTVPYARIEAERLPGRATEELRGWLRGLASPAARERLRRQTLEGALDDLRHGITPLVDAARGDVATAARLAETAEATYARTRDRVADALAEGIPLRQELLARWTDLVGGPRFPELLESATGAVRGWVRATLARRAGAEGERVEREVRREIGGALRDRLVDTLDVLAAETSEAWEAEPAGAQLLAARPDLRRAAVHLADRADDEVTAWQTEIVELVRTKGAERKVRARWLSTVVNAAATGAIVVAFATTGGLTGVEVGIAASAGAVNQWLLTKLLGEQNVRWLLERIREGLLDRAERLAAAERARFDDALDDLAPAATHIERLEAALAAVDRARERV